MAIIFFPDMDTSDLMVFIKKLVRKLPKTKLLVLWVTLGEVKVDTYILKLDFTTELLIVVSPLNPLIMFLILRRLDFSYC